MGVPDGEQAMAGWRRWQRINLRAKEMIEGGTDKYAAYHLAEREIMNDRAGEVSEGDGAGSADTEARAGRAAV